MNSFFKSVKIFLQKNYKILLSIIIISIFLILYKFELSYKIFSMNVNKSGNYILN